MEVFLARTVRDLRLETRSARLKLAPRRDPYWKRIQKGLVVGYRKGAAGGTWIARAFDKSNGRRFEPLGVADDIVDADGIRTLSFDQAQERARSWLAQLALADAGEGLGGPLTVNDAAENYFADFRIRGRAIDEFRRIIDRDIVPVLGKTEVAKLTTRQVRDWHNNLVHVPVPLRAKNGEKPKVRKQNVDREEALRRRKVTANHKLTVLKALLNYAFNEGFVTSDIAWRKVKPFPRVTKAVVRYLSPDEAKELMTAAGSDFQRLIMGALMTGCRYREITSLRCSDFDPNIEKVLVRDGKGGKPRHVSLTRQGSAFFTMVTSGRSGSALAFPRPDGTSWGNNHQQRRLHEACKTAGIVPAISFHVLRHTHASWLAMKGVSLGVIARQLGHADTRITEKHYAHLAPSYVHEEIRANLPMIDGPFGPDASPNTLARGSVGEPRHGP